MPIQNMIGILSVIAIFILALVIMRLIVAVSVPFLKKSLKLIENNMSNEMLLNLRNGENTLENVLNGKTK